MKNADSESEEFIKWVAARIRDLRKEQGYTNYESFAYDKGIPRAQFGRYENGTDMRISSLKKVANAFGMTLSDFFEGMK